MNEREKENLARWSALIHKLLPFADAATDRLPLSRLLRLSMFQVSAGMALVLLTGTINRVAIVELGVSASLISFMVALPMVFAPLRTLLGHKSDNYVSAFGWRRGPFIWFGSMMQFGGLAILPFALLILSGDAVGPIWTGHVGAALAFLLIGAGLHMAQTAGLALATDIAPENVRPRVVALLYVMLLVGMGISAVIFGFLLRDFSQLKLIQIIQGAAVATFGLNLIALWKQEVQNRALTAPDRARKSFGEAWQQLIKTKDMPRLLTVIALGSVGFSMQDILLEPYGGEILSLSVSSTTMLTGLFSLGALIGFAIAAKRLSQGAQPFRLGGFGTLAGILAFSFVIMADPLHSTLLFQVGALLIGLSGGIFSVATLTAMMAYAQDHDAGIVIGAFGAVQATAAGGAIALGGFLRDGISYLANTGMLGPAFDRDIAGYTFVYHLEILILFVCLVAIGPLARQVSPTQPSTDKFGLPAFPG